MPMRMEQPSLARSGNPKVTTDKKAGAKKRDPTAPREEEQFKSQTKSQLKTSGPLRRINIEVAYGTETLIFPGVEMQNLLRDSV